jgi:hypothetical protein
VRRQVVNNTKILFAKLFGFVVFTKADEPLEINQIESENVRTEGRRRRRGEKERRGRGR